MNYLKLQFSGPNWYRLIENKDLDLSMLLGMLYAIKSTYIIDWLDGKYPNTKKPTEMGWGLIEKNNRIFVFCESDPEEEWFNSFSTSKQNMKKIIQDWIEITILREPKPDYIIISRTNDNDENIQFKAEMERNLFKKIKKFARLSWFNFYKYIAEIKNLMISHNVETKTTRFAEKTNFPRDWDYAKIVQEIYSTLGKIDYTELKLHDNGCYEVEVPFLGETNLVAYVEKETGEIKAAYPVGIFWYKDLAEKYNRNKQ